MSKFGKNFSWIVILTAFVWASVTIVIRRSAEAPPGVKVIRIGHWQLEAGVRDGFNELGRDFAALPEVQAKYGPVLVIQDAIPEGVYGQWVSTQMIGGTAPDLVEIGNGLPAPIWLAYENRYFESLSAMASSPNPFNKGTELEHTPLKDTITDGMRSGYIEEMQEYMRVPLSRFASRVFYNKTLLRKLTGSDHAPSDFHGFLKVCETIGAMKDPRGQFYVPIASSKYHLTSWEGNLIDPLTYPVLFRADFNRDGFVGVDELFAAIHGGALSFQSPVIRARFNIAREIFNQFQNGFSGLNREDAIFLFAQQKAVFISTGTWEAGGLIDQAKDKFELGVMTYPQPAKDDPEYGPLVLGPNFDPAGPGFGFGVTRFSKYPDLAKDFLFYLASKKGNERLNQIIGWIPSVQGVPPPALLANFKPVDQGQIGCFNPLLGGLTVVKYQQLYSLFQTDPTFSYDQLAAEYEPFYKDRGQRDWEEQQRDWRRETVTNERFLASLRGEALLQSPDNQNDSRWVRYRTYTTSRQIFPEVKHALQERLISQGAPNSVPPYAYRPEALKRIRLHQDGASTRPNSTRLNLPDSNSGGSP